MGKIRINLSDILKERDMSQAKLAEIANVRPASISTMCRNNTVMLSLEILAKIMKALGITDVGTILEYDE